MLGSLTPFDHMCLSRAADLRSQVSTWASKLGFSSSSIDILVVGALV